MNAHISPSHTASAVLIQERNFSGQAPGMILSVPSEYLLRENVEVENIAKYDGVLVPYNIEAL